MRLNHNMNSLSIYRTYKNSLGDNSSVIDRISTGLKIVGAKDNPNKIVQSEQMRLQIKSLESSSRNVQDGISMVQTAEGALNDISNILVRMKELVVKASNETNSPEDLKATQDEIDQLKAGIDQITKDTGFNGVAMLNTEGNNPNAGKNGNVVKNGTVITGFLKDERMEMPYFKISTKLLEDKDGNLLSDIDVTKGDATKYIDTVTAAVATIANVRGKYGAISGRLENTSENIDNNSYNLQRAESNIRDANLGEEIVEFSRTKILIDAARAITVQTNNIPKNALNILRNSI